MYNCIVFNSTVNILQHTRTHIHTHLLFFISPFHRSTPFHIPRNNNNNNNNKQKLARTDAFRYMVTVCVSFTASDDVTAKEFQNQLVEGIRIAITNGIFTKNQF